MTDEKSVRLPTGTVTFCMTDVVGSTRLWEEAPDAMRVASARHDALVDEAVFGAGGVVVRPRGEGDSRFAVFERPSQAAAGVVAILTALASEQWPTPRPIEVRVAVHTGEVDFRDGDYYGSAVNRCARLRSLAHPSQALVSQAVAEIVAESLPPGATLTDLGAHRLKDLSRPERVFGLTAPGLRTEFPPLASIDASANNLPVQLSSFVGRETELASARAGLEAARLVTLTGPGGSGKTRLSLQVAAEAIDSFPDGAWLVELAALTNSDQVSAAVATTMGVKEAPGRTLTGSVAAHVADRGVLVVLDNCEHVLDAAAALAADLLRAGPRVSVLATSQVPLGVAGERVHPVPSMSIPDPDQSDLAVLADSDAVRLFVERASLTRPSFALSAANAGGVAQICRRLDGVPLAIELAAARTRALSPDQIAARLDDRFHLLTGGTRGAPSRHQTLRAALEWSYQLLSDDEATLLNRLSVFAGGFDLDAAEAVAADDGLDSWEVLDLVAALVDKSLLTTIETDNGGLRYRLLETIRAFAAENLRRAPPLEARVRNRHLQWSTSIVQDFEGVVNTDDEDAQYERIAAEEENLWSALGQARQLGAQEDVLILTGALAVLYDFDGRFSEGLELCDEALAGCNPGPVQRRKILLRAGNLALSSGRYDNATARYQEALTLARELEDVGGTWAALNNLGVLATFQGDFQVAKSYFEENQAIVPEAKVDASFGYFGDQSAAELSLYRGDLLSATDFLDRAASGPALLLAEHLWLRGTLAYAQAAMDEARRCFDASIASAAHTGGWVEYDALSQHGLAMIAMWEKKLDDAGTYLDRGLQSARTTGNPRCEALLMHATCLLRRRHGDDAAAIEAERASIRLRIGMGDKYGLIHNLETLAGLAADTGDPVRAAYLVGAAHGGRECIGATIWPSEQTERHADLTTIRQALTVEAFNTAWALGHDQPIVEVAAETLN